MSSLRLRLAIVLTIGFSALILTTGVLVFRSVQTHAICEFDKNLVSRLMEMSGRVENEKGEIQLDYKGHHNPEFEREQFPSHFQIWFANGEELYRSTRLGHDLLAAELLGTTQPHDHVLPGGRRLRVASRAYTLRDDGDQDDAVAATEGGVAVSSDAVVSANKTGKQSKSYPSYQMVFAVARGREGLDRMLASMQQMVVWSGIVAALLGLAFVFFAVQKGLRPLRRMEQQVAQLTPGDPEQRVTTEHMPDELAPIANQVNALVERVETAMRRERSFTGNVAHELRTPVSELASLAQVAGRWPDDKLAVQRFFGDVESISRRMQAVISNMLLLARCANGREPTIGGTCQLGTLLATIWQRHQAQAKQRDLRLTVQPHEHDVVATDCDKLTLIIDNLLGNAICYANEGTTICASIVTRAAQTRLRIGNQAERLPEHALRRLSEPFWRLDEARASVQHAGLGLSVVGALALRLGLTVEFAQDDDNCFEVTVRGFQAALANSDLASGSAPDLPDLRANSRTGNDS